MYDFVKKCAHPSNVAHGDLTIQLAELKAIYQRQIVESFIDLGRGLARVPGTPFLNFFFENYESELIEAELPYHIIALLRLAISNSEANYCTSAALSCVIWFKNNQRTKSQTHIQFTFAESVFAYSNEHYIPAITMISLCNDSLTLNAGDLELNLPDLKKQSSNFIIPGTGINVMVHYCGDFLLEGNKIYSSFQNVQNLQKSLTEALLYLNESAPLYYKWVIDTVETIVIVEGVGQYISSGSDLNFPGIVNISYPSSSIAIAEMLVHESSHQYWFQSLWFEDVVDGSDPGLYFSPIKQCDRPLWAIHTAYHAFSNVAIFYNQCIQSKIKESAYCEKQLPLLLDQMAVLETTLSSTNGLTETGKLLWMPLAEKLKDIKCS